MHLHFFITTTSIHYKPSWTHKLEENTERLANLGSDYSMVLSATLEFANAGHYSETTLELSRKLSAIKNSPSTSTGLKSLVYLAANPPHTQAHEAEGESSRKIINFHVAVYPFNHVHSNEKFKHRAQIEIVQLLDHHNFEALEITQIVQIFEFVYGNPEYYDLKEQLAGLAAR